MKRPFAPVNRAPAAIRARAMGGVAWSTFVTFSDAARARTVVSGAARMSYSRTLTGVLLSADTDFGGLLARQRADKPSVLLIRRLVGPRAAEQVTIVLDNLDTVAADLETGAIAVLTDTVMRRLPVLPR